MASLHVWKAIEKARKNGGFAGDERAFPLWELSKRELVEVAVRLASMTTNTADDVGAAVEVVNAELKALRANGII